jgi:hypothetical protein
MRPLVRHAIPLPQYRVVSTTLLPLLRAPKGQFAYPSHVSRRTIFRTGTALPAGLNPRVGAIFLGLIGLGFVSTMFGVSVCRHLSPSMTS